MSDHSITSLIEKLEGATGGSRELDGALHRALFPNDLIMTDSGSVGPVKREAVRQPLFSVPQFPDAVVADCIGAPFYSTSLDAALALAERTGWRAYAIDGSIIRQTSVMLQSLDDRPGTDAETGAHMIGKDYSRATAKTPALALCAATLRAQSEARV